MLRLGGHVPEPDGLRRPSIDASLMGLSPPRSQKSQHTSLTPQCCVVKSPPAGHDSSEVRL